jgi:hypothetical protein
MRRVLTAGLVGNPYRHWCHASPGTTSLDSDYSNFHTCDCSYPYTTGRPGNPSHYARDSQNSAPNCGLRMNCLSLPSYASTEPAKLSPPFPLFTQMHTHSS